jgi:hypothetical protein
MKNVLSVRLNERAMGRLQDLARQRGKELSAVARELIDDGLVLAAMREYREGRLSEASETARALLVRDAQAAKTQSRRSLAAARRNARSPMKK